MFSIFKWAAIFVLGAVALAWLRTQEPELRVTVLTGCALILAVWTWGEALRGEEESSATELQQVTQRLQAARAAERKSPMA